MGSEKRTLCYYRFLKIWSAGPVYRGWFQTRCLAYSQKALRESFCSMEHFLVALIIYSPISELSLHCLFFFILVQKCFNHCAIFPFDHVRSRMKIWSTIYQAVKLCSKIRSEKLFRKRSSVELVLASPSKFCLTNIFFGIYRFFFCQISWRPPTNVFYQWNYVFFPSPNFLVVQWSPIRFLHMVYPVLAMGYFCGCGMLGLTILPAFLTVGSSGASVECLKSF